MPAAAPPPWALTARWLFPVSGPPLERGTITISGDTIVSVDAAGVRTSDLDLGNVAVIPGLVNAHVHLDLSSVTGPVPYDGDFTHWLRGVIAHRRSLSPEQVELAVRTGLSESLKHGVTLLGDISGGGLSWGAMSTAPCRAVVFHELIGLPRDRADGALAAARSWLESLRLTETCRPGISPHAPYSVSDELLRGCAELSTDIRIQLATHLGETQAERELLEHRNGPFVPFLESLGVFAPEGLVASPEKVCGMWDEMKVVNPLYIHGNYLDPDHVRGNIVYCPRTHAYFGHAPHPFRDFLARGVNVALGTDSLASNPDLDLLAEARFLHGRYPGFPGEKLLRMATLAGAEALGWAHVAGSLAPGKSADLVAVPLPETEKRDPHALLFGSDLVGRRVMWRGRWR